MAIEELMELIEYCKKDVLDGVSDTQWVEHVASHALEELKQYKTAHEERGRIKTTMYDKGFLLKIPLDPDDYNALQKTASSYGSVTVYDHMLDINDLSLLIVFKRE